MSTKAHAKTRKVGTARKPVVSHYTREMANKIAITNENKQPVVDLARIKQIVPGQQVWDGYFCVDHATGVVANIGGFKVLVLLARDTTDPDFSHSRQAYIYAPYDSDEYVFGGYICGGTKLYGDINEWSGSVIHREDGKIQTFYTIASNFEKDGIFQTHQRFATAISGFKVVPTEDGIGKLVIEEPTYHGLLAEPDGIIYETTEQSVDLEKRFPTLHNRALESDGTANHCFRDPKYFEHEGRKFLLFEANTAPDYKHGPARIRPEYVGSAATADEYVVSTDDLKANGCIGVMELTDEENTFGVFQEPWMTFNLFSAEVERINIVKHQNAFYLFTCTHSTKSSALEHAEMINVDMLLGFRASYFLGPLVPLNESGVVIAQKSLGAPYGGADANQQYVYSWLILPRADSGVSNVFDVTAYTNYSTDANGTIQAVKATSPTLQLEMKGLNTRIVGQRYDVNPSKRTQEGLQEVGASRDQFSETTPTPTATDLGIITPVPNHYGA